MRSYNELLDERTIFMFAFRICFTRKYCFSKMQLVNTYVKPAVLSKIDPRQFGTVPKSSTTHALISMNK